MFRPLGDLITLAFRSNLTKGIANFVRKEERERRHKITPYISALNASILRRKYQIEVASMSRCSDCLFCTFLQRVSYLTNTINKKFLEESVYDLLFITIFCKQFCKLHYKFSSERA